jgi:hypothetical protein
MTNLRQRFEQWISAPPYSWSVQRYPADESLRGWPGQYTDHQTQLAWEAFCAVAASGSTAHIADGPGALKDALHE